MAGKAKCHLLVQVKQNQPNLLRTLETIAGTQCPLGQHETLDEGKRLRFERRTAEVFDVARHLQDSEWAGLIMHAIRMKRSTLICRAKDGVWEHREETAFYVCTGPISAEKAAEAIRSHWGVENKNHYVRDVSLMEDACRIRCNPGIFARARSFALNILRLNGEDNIADALWKNALDFNRPLKYRYK